MANKNTLLLLPRTDEELIVSGLVNLGVLVAIELSLGVHLYRYSDITIKLMVLLK